MTEAERFVVSLYDNFSFNAGLVYTTKSAKEDLAELKKAGYDIPDGLTAEILKDTWNEAVFRHHKMVELPSGREVSRVSQMSIKQIAETIMDADSPSDVYDLIGYVADHLHLPKDGEGAYIGWSEAVDSWCRENI